MDTIGKRTAVCLACGKRIRDEHPNIGVEDMSTRSELLYHASVECQIAAAEQLDKMMRGGGLYVINHYHACGDGEHGFDCVGGCFSGAEVLGRN